MSITVKNLSYSYGRQDVLKGLNFSLNLGFNILLGPNGAGKSTLFSLLTGLAENSESEITVCECSMKEQKRKALERIGVVFQQSTLDLDLTVKQNLLYHASLQGLSSEEALHNIADILSRLQLSERLNERVRSLNGGHRRRLEIARALMHKPKVLLLDEPTVGLDSDSRMLIIEHIRQLAIERGICILWATHLMDEVAKEDQLILLDKGQIRAFGLSESLCEKNEVPDVFQLYHKLTKNPEIM